MARNCINKYIDIVQTHPDLTAEELDQLIEESIEADKKLTEWPDI